MGSVNSNNKTGCKSLPVDQIRHGEESQIGLDTKAGPSSYYQKSNKENTDEVESNMMCAQILQNNKKQREFRKNKKFNNNLSLTSLPSVSHNVQRKSQVEICRLEKPLHANYQQKLKYFQNNKKIIQQSIEATICVERALNILCHHEILQSTQFDYLNAKNKRSLECKQKRYKNLELREKKMIISREVNATDREDKQQKQQSNSVHHPFHGLNIQKKQCRPSLNIYKK